MAGPAESWGVLDSFEHQALPNPAAVMMRPGGIAQAHHLRDAGYSHPELRRCILEYMAAGDLHRIHELRADDHIVDENQALEDAEQLLTTPAVSAAVSTLAERLLTDRDLDAERIAAVIAESGLTRTMPPPVWAPGKRWPVVPH